MLNEKKIYYGVKIRMAYDRTYGEAKLSEGWQALQA
jgi:hypothetical protein